ncbi:hypothetical protein M0804_007511 [Polistes exclamans]|nr:hypothetical protein M0804_007511 [Polistes exclamans]
MVLLIFPPARQILCIRRESMSPREDDISPTSTSSVETYTEAKRECKKEYGKESNVVERDKKEKEWMRRVLMQANIHKSYPSTIEGFHHSFRVLCLHLGPSPFWSPHRSPRFPLAFRTNT